MEGQDPHGVPGVPLVEGMDPHGEPGVPLVEGMDPHGEQQIQQQQDIVEGSDTSPHEEPRDMGKDPVEEACPHGVISRCRHVEDTCPHVMPRLSGASDGCLRERKSTEETLTASLTT